MPRRPQERTDHNCSNLRLPTRGGLYAGEFAKDRCNRNVRVNGQLVFGTLALMLNGALAGFGVAFPPEDNLRSHLDRGRLRVVLEDWCPPFSGYHLYYRSHRQMPPAFALLIDALRYNEGAAPGLT